MRRPIRHPSETARTLPNAHPVIGSRGDSRDTGMSAAEMRERAAQWRDEQPQTVTCAKCPDWRFEGSVLECREAFQAHQAVAHPSSGRKRRRPSGFFTAGLQGAKADRARANAAALRRKKAA